MAKIYADKFGYKVDGNQEMFGEVTKALCSVIITYHYFRALPM